MHEASKDPRLLFRSCPQSSQLVLAASRRATAVVGATTSRRTVVFVMLNATAVERLDTFLRWPRVIFFNLSVSFPFRFYLILFPSFRNLVSFNFLSISFLFHLYSCISCPFDIYYSFSVLVRQV